MENFFVLNLKKLCQMQSQKEVAVATGVSPASISNYLAGSEPPVKFLLKLKEIYEFNIDEFLTKEYSFAEYNKATNNEKFLGTYILYYYDAGVYKGRASVFSKNTLKYGILFLYEQYSHAKAICTFLSDREKAEDLRKEIEGKNLEQVRKLFENNSIYEGNATSSNTQFFINLKSEQNDDQCLIIVNNPPSYKSYIGGLGTVNSVSRGREHMPCVQFMIISKYILNVPDGAIYNLLSLGVPEIDTKNDAEKLYNLVKRLEATDELSEYQKLKIFEDSLENTVKDLIEANTFRFAKVSNMEDDDYYRIIKEQG